jgi:hypothetical protein
MDQKVSLFNVKKGTPVRLSKPLPIGRGFGNNYPLPTFARGYVKSDGFVSGQLKVDFDSHMYGKETVTFHELSAREYLVVNIY